MRGRMFALVALVIAILISLTPTQDAFASSGNVIPLQSELRVGSYVNLTESGVTSAATGQPGYATSYSGFVNETINFVSPSQYKVITKIGSSGSVGVLTLNVTGNFSPKSTYFPYFNNTNVYYLGPNSTVGGTFTFSNGTYAYDGQVVPMEKVVITDWTQLNSTMPLSTIEFDSYSGIMLNFTYESVVNNSVGAGGPILVYTNGSSILSSTNLTMVPPPHGSSGGYLLPAAAVAVVAVLFVGAIVAVRMRRRIR